MTEWWRFAGDWKDVSPQIYAIRIPKAASSALVVTLKDLAFIPVHEYRLSYVPEGGIAFAVMRDPIDRFRSTFDMYTTWENANVLERFPTINDFVDAGPEQWRSSEWGCGYWKATWWLKSAEYVKERGAIVIDYRTFADDFVQMGFPKPAVSHPSVRKWKEKLPPAQVKQLEAMPGWTWGGTELSDHSKAVLREYYDGDYRLMEELWR